MTRTGRRRSIEGAAWGCVSSVLLLGCAAPGTGDDPTLEAALPPAQSTASSRIRFRDAAGELGLKFQAGIQGRSPLNIAALMGGGAGWLDLDGDGWEDLVLTGPAGVAFYRNETGRAFRELTLQSGLDPKLRDVQGVAVGDFDADGRPDLLLTLRDGVRLYRNHAGHLEDVTRQAGLQLRRWTTSAAVADVDGNGTLDLYVGRYVHFRAGMPEFLQDGEARLTLGPAAYEADVGVLYRNDGQGHFQDITTAAGLSGSHGKTLGVSFADYDLDGDQDLYLANDEVPCDFYVNDGRGRFRNAALENGTALSATGQPQAGMGVDWGDYNGDGLPDLVVTTFLTEPTSLYRQERGGLFTEESQTMGLLAATRRWTGFGVAFEDWDNDGRLDLLQANGHVADQQDRVDAATGFRQPLQLFHNRGSQFHDVSENAGPPFRERAVGRALAVADYDRDGRMDALIANLTGPPVLLHNETQPKNWLGARLKGAPPNREGIGAVLRLTTASGTQTRLMTRSRSYLSSVPAEVRFGLGFDTAGVLEVQWPGGRIQRVGTLPAGKTHALTGSPKP